MAERPSQREQIRFIMRVGVMAAGSHETKAKLTGGDFLNQIFDSSRIGPIAYYL
jgi:hypothetical protein